MAFSWLRKYRERRQRVFEDIDRDVRLLQGIMMLDGERIFSFPMFGEEVKLFLPYASFDYIQSSILLKADFFEGNLLRYVKNKYFNNVGQHVVLDIGANIGNHSVFFAKFCNAKVVAFEPQNTIYSILQKNTCINNLNIDSYNCALGEARGSGRIENYETSNTGATKITESVRGTLKVESLDSFGFKDVDFIKMDVEGFEEGVLLGARETLKSCSPVIWIEIFPDNKTKVFSLLKSLGYRLEEQLAQDDYVFVPDSI